MDRHEVLSEVGILRDISDNFLVGGNIGSPGSGPLPGSAASTRSFGQSARGAQNIVHFFGFYEDLVKYHLVFECLTETLDQRLDRLK